MSPLQKKKNLCESVCSDFTMCVLILYCIVQVCVYVGVCVLTHVSLGIIRANYMEGERQMLSLAHVTVVRTLTPTHCKASN